MAEHSAVSAYVMLCAHYVTSVVRVSSSPCDVGNSIFNSSHSEDHYS